MKLKIAEDLSLPLDAATQTFAFIARKGAGKTYTAGKLVELLLDAGVQVAVIDTVGNWYGLRLGADGKSAGYDVPVLGGLRGDIPLEAAGGALIADIVVETGRSIVVDVSQFSLADRKRFAAAFGERLWQRKKGERHPSPLHLVIEESQLIVPQDVRGDTAVMVGIFEEIIRLGRNYGIGVSMITQRPQSVNKEVLNQTECLFVGQVNGAQERKALKLWITHQGMDVHLVDELPSLKIGTFYVWSPQWLGLLQKIRVLPKRTYDASATPKVGDKRVQRDLKPLDLSELQERLKATIEKAKAEDPRELRKQLAEAQRMLARQEKTIGELQARPPAGKPKAVEKPVLKDGQLARAEKLVERVVKMQDAILQETTALFQAASAIADAIASTRAPHQHTPATITQRVERRPLPASSSGRGTVPAATVSRPAPRVSASSEPGERLPPGEKATLVAAAQYPDGVARDQLSVLTGYKRSSRDAYIQRLVGRGYVALNGSGTIVATDEGITALGSDFEALPQGDELRDWWLQRLPPGEKAVLNAAINFHPAAVERATIDELTGYKRSSRDAYIQRLVARRLVTADRGAIRASDTLFG